MTEKGHFTSLLVVCMLNVTLAKNKSFLLTDVPFVCSLVRSFVFRVCIAIPTLSVLDF